MSEENKETYAKLKSMAQPSDRKDDDEASESKHNQLVAQEEDGDYDCQTPTSDDHKIQPPRFSLPPPPPPRKLLQKRIRRSSVDRTLMEFFEHTRREEVDAFFQSFTVRVSSSTSRKKRSHSV
ncbi:cyclin-dependent protein kinase inhibitor SMR1 [Lactuca sativa]|uniref:cyclin-dependent protein kinase inhibitor SMR1 n=1 Tax=Lactuca sativa TaxID=4236 RepID=UPI000CABEA2C|nr:cyclin-dependent protein kinase inhibitor SMR1 [Lactuca sativa]